MHRAKTAEAEFRFRESRASVRMLRVEICGDARAIVRRLRKKVKSQAGATENIPQGLKA